MVPYVSTLTTALHPGQTVKTMEVTIQEIGKAFTIFYDMFHELEVIVQEGVEFRVNHPSGSLGGLEPM